MLLNRVYKNTIKSSTQSRKQSAPKVLRNISVILDSRLGIDKIHFKKLNRLVHQSSMKDL